MKIIFAGTPAFAATSLEALIKSGHEICAVYTQPDRPSGRGQKLTASPVKELALRHDLPVFQPVNFKTDEDKEILKTFEADVMIVAAYGLILPAAVLAIPKLGCINIHASWLPRWRGAAPIQRAILAGDTETGISIMQMEAGLDTGDVFCVHGCEITSIDTSASLHDKLAVLGAEAILETLNDVVSGKLIRTPQQGGLVTYAHKITKAEAQIDWTQSALDIDRQVRAFYGWPVAYTQLNETVLRIWQATPVAADPHAAPGTIVGMDKEGIDIACGKGVLRIQEIQWPGGTRQKVAAISHLSQIGLEVGRQFKYDEKP
jgi:methionyl-tRNA formyltransferase